jgi:ABC-2 type transport system permease protein
MFWKIFTFELKYRLFRPATYLYFLILFLFAFLSAVYGNVPGSEKTYINSAYTLGLLIIILTIFEIMISSAVMGVPVYRDIEYNTKGYFMAYPISEKGYLLGRFLGSFVVLILISLGVHFGMILGSIFGPIVGDEGPERYGPFNYMYYLYPTLLFTIPNLFFTGTIFFSLVALTRKIYVTYVGSILFFIGWLLANSLTQDIEYRNYSDILDPFGFNAFLNATRYWTPAEQNTVLIPLTGNLLWNRILWVGISLIIFLYTLYRFDFQRFLAVKLGKGKKEEETPRAKEKGIFIMPKVSKVFSFGIYFRQMFGLANLEFKNIVRDYYFQSILLGGVLFLFLDGWFGNPTFGTPSLPMTYYMLEVKDFNYIIFVFIILIFYTGEVVHRDKSVNYANISDALPIPNWLTYGSKFLALVYVCFLLVNLVLICGIFNQIIKGYFNFELDKYFIDLYLIEFPEYIQLVMLAFIIHILVNQKFVGHFIAIGFWVLMIALRSIFETDYNLFFYSSTPGYVVSDMNGFGHFGQALFWFNWYWLSCGAFLLTVGNLMWNRGAESSFKTRLKLARQRLNPITGTALAVFFLSFLLSGIYIYYNVSVWNQYQTAEQARKNQAEYEKKYRKYEFAIQPKIFDVKIKADIFPERRFVKVAGVMQMTNKSTQAIDSLFIQMSNGQSKIKVLKINGLEPELLMKDSIAQFSIYKLPKKMMPGDTVQMDVAVEVGYKGFPNSGVGREVVYNGTFFDLNVLPGFGYSAFAELQSDKYRKKYGLKKQDYRQPKITDKRGLSNLLFNDDADYVTFEATVSTSPDQIAVAPGYLQKEWTANGRRYFQYKMNSEMDYFFNVSSARYAVKKALWQGKKGEKVNIEIFHDPKHTFNLDRFMNGVKASLDYFNANFSPYQYTQMRILEFPRYAGFAQSFPNTVPYSESFGWVADFSDPNKTDYAFYVTSHEVAHQWWGHQITPSNTRGSNQISESMAEYSALMVLKKEYGEEVMQKFLRYALDRYLGGRANEDKFEDNLIDNESRAYVWYQKGSLILYALQDLVGEANLNKAFAKFLKDAAFRQKPPFATSHEWYKYIQEVTPDSLKYFIEDSFTKMALYENRITSAEATDLKNGSYKVKLKVNTKKIYYDGLGNEKGQGKGKDYIDIGIFTTEGKNAKGMTKKVPLYLKKHALGAGEHTFEFTVKGKPLKAGIDPYNKLIDRIPDDNVKNVDIK